jgi:Uncharacterized conserved protein
MGVQTKEQILSLIQEHQSQIRNLGVRRLGLFGSFVRRQQDSNSDIDVLVEFESGRKTFDNFIQVALFLEELFGRRVELVTLRPSVLYIGPHICGRLNMSLSAVEYVRHMLDETGYLIDQTQGLTWDQFMRDATLQRAFVRSLEIIGEASKRIPDDFKQKYGHLEWRAMAGMRDRLIHGYFGVDYGIVWDVVTNKIPVLHRAIKEIIEAESSTR